MKRIFALVFLLTFIALPCLAGSVQDKCKAVIKAKGGSTTTAYCATCTGTCVYCEDFEGATDCGATSDDNNCRYTYTETVGAGGTLDYGTAQTTSQCSSTATKSLLITRAGADVNTLKDWGASSTTVYISGYLKVNTNPVFGAGSAKEILAIANATGTYHVKIQIYNDGGTYKLRLLHFNQSVGAVYTLLNTHSTGTWYRFRIYWKANQSSGGVDAYIDSTQYTPADTSTYNSNLRIIQYLVTTNDASVEFDNVRIQTDAYPACP